MKRMINVFNYLLVSAVFTAGFVFFRTPFEFYVGYVFMISFLIWYVFSFGKLEINSVFILTLTLVSIFSLLSVFFKDDHFLSFLKPFLGFLFNGVVYYLLIKVNRYDVNRIFCVYMKFALIIAMIGIFQEFSFLVGFKYGYDYSYFIQRFSIGGTALGMLRVTSILPEPSHFGGAMAPAIFVSVLNVINGESHFISRKASFLIITSVLLSLSVVSYLGIVIALILVLCNCRKFRLISMGVVVLFVFIWSFYSYVPDMHMRINDTIAVMTGKEPLGLGNLSTFAFCSNAMVAWKSFLNNPLFGSGLGSHPLSYDRYIAQIIGPNAEPDRTLRLCADDAGSLLFRLISETGLFGVLLFFYFIIRFYVSKGKDGYFWIISNSILCLFVVNLTRMGNYFYCGLILFVWIYYFANKNATHLS